MPAVNVFETLGCATGDAAFEKIPNKSITGGFEDDDAHTLDKCFISCLLKSITDCSGVEFRDGKCFIFTNETNSGPFVTGDEHYNRKLCGK